MSRCFFGHGLADGFWWSSMTISGFGLSGWIPSLIELVCWVGLQASITLAAALGDAGSS